MFLLHLMIKTNHIIPLFVNNCITIINCSSFLPKSFPTWYKQNTKQNINHFLQKKTTPIRNTPEKLSSVPNNRTLREITHLIDPYKRNTSDNLIFTLTHIIHCYDRTHKLLQSLDLDSQRITQSSQAIQSALESLTTLLNAINLH